MKKSRKELKQEIKALKKSNKLWRELYSDEGRMEQAWQNTAQEIAGSLAWRTFEREWANLEIKALKAK